MRKTFGEYCSTLSSKSKSLANTLQTPCIGKAVRLRVLSHAIQKQERSRAPPELIASPANFVVMLRTTER